MLFVKNINGGEFTGERALFASRSLSISKARFYDGESPLKESADIRLDGCRFEWKYPLWYSKNIVAENTYLADTARSGIWYTENITMSNCLIDAPKTFRRSKGIVLRGVTMPNAQESMWNCSDIELSDVSIVGDYFGMGAVGVKAEKLKIDGNYLLDGARNVEIRNSRLISKDAFWNCENVVVYNSLIVGEYLGWNSKNVTFINCEIESNQGMCYMQNLTLRSCRFRNTDLCFEYCTVDAEVDSYIDSIKNPISGRIVAKEIGSIILDPECVDVTKTEITEVNTGV